MVAQPWPTAYASAADNGKLVPCTRARLPTPTGTSCCRLRRRPLALPFPPPSRRAGSGWFVLAAAAPTWGACGRRGSFPKGRILSPAKLLRTGRLLSRSVSLAAAAATVLAPRSRAGGAGLQLRDQGQTAVHWGPAGSCRVSAAVQAFPGAPGTPTQHFHLTEPGAALRTVPWLSRRCQRRCMAPPYLCTTPPPPAAAALWGADVLVWRSLCLGTAPCGGTVGVLSGPRGGERGPCNTRVIPWRGRFSGRQSWCVWGPAGTLL